MNFCIAGYLLIKSSPNNAIWFLKTSFLEAIKYFRLSIGAIVQRSFYPKFAGSQNWKSYVDAKEEPTYLYDNVYESSSYWLYIWPIKTKPRRHFGALPGLPLTQFRVAFDVWNKWNVWKGIPIFLVGKFQTEIRISCLQTFFEYLSFRLLRPFFVNSVHHLPKPWSDQFTREGKALCPKACDTASSHCYLPLGTFRQRAVRGGCIAEYALYTFCIIVDRSNDRSLQYL